MKLIFLAVAITIIYLSTINRERVAPKFKPRPLETTQQGLP
jgi:hypothetical protein